MPADTPAAMLDAMAKAKRFNRWMADTLLPFVDGNVLEIGAGIGNLTTLLCSRARQYIAAEIDADYLPRLQARTKHCSNVTTTLCDVSKSSDLEQFRGRMDTVVSLNVLEHIRDDASALGNMRACLKGGGRALVLVPQGMGAFGTLDVILEHQRRYSRSELRGKMTAAGFRVERMLDFNRITYPGWFFNGRVLRRKTLSRAQLRVFDWLVPLWRRIDRALPCPPTSIIGIGVRDN